MSVITSKYCKDTTEIQLIGMRISFDNPAFKKKVFHLIPSTQLSLTSTMLLVYLGGPQSGCFKLNFSPDGQWIASSCAVTTPKIGSL